MRRDYVVGEGGGEHVKVAELPGVISYNVGLGSGARGGELQEVYGPSGRSLGAA